MPFQGFGCVDRALFVSDGSGPVVRDISSADGGFSPMLLEPVEELLRGVDFGLLFGWSCWASKAFEDGLHDWCSLSCCAMFALMVRLIAALVDGGAWLI